MTFENITNEEYRKAAQEYFLATEDITSANVESAQNGHKCLALMYLGRADDWSDREVYEGEIILDLASKRLLDIEFVDENR